MTIVDPLPFDEISLKLSADFRDKLIEIEKLIKNEMTPSRDLSIAITHLETAQMWINRAIRNAQASRLGL